MMKKPKIAILSIKNSYPYGGVFATLKTAYDFCAQHFEPTIFVASFDPAISAHLRPLQCTSTTRNIDYHGMPCVEVGVRWAFWEPGHYAWTRDAWQQVLSDYEYVFVVSATPIAGHPAYLLNKKYILWASTPYDADRTERVRLLVGVRKLIDYYAHDVMISIEQQVLTSAALVIPLSTYARTSFQERAPQAHYASFNVGQPVRLPVYDELHVSSRIILAVGRFNDPRKNATMLFRVFKRLVSCYPNIQLVIIGQQPLEADYAAYVHEPWFSQVTFTGPIHSLALADWYRRAWLKVITSYQEGLGITGIEAMSYGIPIVATDCGGVRDFVIPDKTGSLVAVNDDDAMVSAVESYMIDQARYQSCRQKARDLVAQSYSHQYVYDCFTQACLQVYPGLTISQESYECADHQSYVHRAHQP